MQLSFPDDMKRRVEEKFNDLGDMCERGELEPEEAYKLLKVFEDEIVMRYVQKMEVDRPHNLMRLLDGTRKRRTLLSLIEEAGKANKLADDARVSYVKDILGANPAFMERLRNKTMRLQGKSTVRALDCEFQ
ncbi:hypothetical protein GBA52_013871 [Prunus armeniaca]|nr:hypothetical protein GBA52_013871 [Prunus armeniaca]